MAKVTINVKVKAFGSESVMTFKNTLQLLYYLANTGAKVLPDKTIEIN